MAKVNINSTVLVKAHRNGTVTLLFTIDGNQIEVPITEEKFNELCDKNFFVS